MAIITCIISYLMVSIFYTEATWDAWNLSVNYNKMVSPQSLDDDILTIHMAVEIREISCLVEKYSELTIVMFWKLYWTENRININPETADTVLWPVTIDNKFIKTFWTPDAVVASVKYYRQLSMQHSMESMRIYHNKTLRHKIGCEITVVCPMDFSLYPMDSHICNLDFTSFSLSEKFIQFSWHETDEMLFWPHWNRLANFDVKVEPELHPYKIRYGRTRYSVIRLRIYMVRRILPFVLNTYIPSTGFVIISWISFLVPAVLVPGRMVLLVTTLLTLVTMYESTRSVLPETTSLKCIEIWLMICILIVFCALLEYAYLLYLKKKEGMSLCSWTKKKKRVESLLKSIFRNNNITTPLFTRSTQDLEMSEESGGYTLGSKRGFITEDMSSSEKDHKAVLDNMGQLPVSKSTSEEKSIAKEIDKLDEDSQNQLDHMSLIAFPTVFLIFAVVYWSVFLSSDKHIIETDS